MSSLFCNLLEYSNSSFWLRRLINRATAYRLSPEFSCVTSKYVPTIFFFNLRHIYYKTHKCIDIHQSIGLGLRLFFKGHYRLKFSLSLFINCIQYGVPPTGFLKYVQFGKLNRKAPALTSYPCAVMCVVCALGRAYYFVERIPTVRILF